MKAEYQFPLDHFGVVASPLIRALLEQSSDRRKRKSALSALMKMAKATKQIPQDAIPTYIGLLTDSSGQLWLYFHTQENFHEVPNSNPSAQA